MGFVKDMREGQLYLKDHDDYLDVYRAEGSGLKVINVSHFPKNGDKAMPLSAFVPEVQQRCKENNLIHKSGSASRTASPELVPCMTYSAMPAVARKGPATPRVPKVHVASFGLENYWKKWIR
eukprot:8023996-Karenia_brevis.AAC.1